MLMKKTRFNMKVTVIMDQTLMRRKIIFSRKTTMPLMNRMTMSIMDLLKIGSGNLSQMIWEIPIYKIIIMVHMG